MPDKSDANDRCIPDFVDPELPVGVVGVDAFESVS